MKQVPAYAAQSEDAPLGPFSINRREVGPEDVAIDIDYCGVCHSDIHTARNEWGGRSVYPCVPGHEIIGRVTEIGGKVAAFKAGDLVGVGCLVDSCQSCEACEDHEEQHCHQGATQTYGSKDPYLGGPTHGGYSKHIVVRDKFVLRIPENLDARAVAPLLCAGITTWSPLAHWKVGKGDKVGVIGLGGLGHMGVKFANALGADVTMITTSPEKGEDAKKLGAHHVLISKNRDEMKAHRSKFDFLLNTIPVKHDLNSYMGLLKRNGTMVIVGAIEPFDGLHSGLLLQNRRRLAGSAIGGLKETQEMLDFCGEHNIVSDIEMVDIQDINTAWDRVVAADVKYRFVIDMASLPAQ
ncbi:NAD(P)-dependent alcohol dehydrogenase [Hyphococcus sp.]|uniref:NAD(P)-dependent alcohol dehydrogenase n=1 Tax=Hyphococcus sp. TaxID=2038636 RepID=UPI00207E0455|nr:MAG: alcohol dehydrogenase [Marinicaulis sp.]